MGTVLPSVVEFVLGGFTDMASTLLSTPLFLIGVGFFCVGGFIGLVKRIIS